MLKSKYTLVDDTEVYDLLGFIRNLGHHIYHLSWSNNTKSEKIMIIAKPHKDSTIVVENHFTVSARYLENECEELSVEDFKLYVEEDYSSKDV